MDPSFAPTARTTAPFVTKRLKTWLFSPAIKPFARLAFAAETVKRKSTTYNTLEPPRESFV